MGIEQARRAARKAQERTYEGRATVYEYREVFDPDTFLTDNKEVAVLENQPCIGNFIFGNVDSSKSLDLQRFPANHDFPKNAKQEYHHVVGQSYFSWTGQFPVWLRPSSPTLW